MMNVLKLLKNEFENLNIPYTYDNWDDDLELPQFVGEILEIPTVDEDGKNEYSFILSGFATSYGELFEVADLLKGKFKPSAIIDGVVIQYDSTKPIENDTDDLKEIEINLKIKKWSI